MTLCYPILRHVALTGLVLALVGCAGSEQRSPDSPGAATPDDTQATADAGDSGGRYAMRADAYPLDPPDVSDVPDAVPRQEPRSSAGNRSRYTVWGKQYRVLADASGYNEVGTASWYGNKFHGYATANGEIYDMYRMSAAHRSLPLPTFARVSRPGTDKAVIVRVNDRGPFHSDRIIDLSYAAASQLGLTDHGTGRVRVEAIDPAQWQAGRQQENAAAEKESAAPRQPSADERAPQEGTYWQVAALENRQGAEKLQRRLQNRLAQPVRIARHEDIYRVQVGPAGAETDEQALRDALRRAGFPRAFVVP